MEYSEGSMTSLPAITLPHPFSSSSSSSSASPPSSHHSSPSDHLPPPSPPPAVVLSPCAACKILRRRCAEKCILAPYFPPTEPLKFTTAHRVFGASNIIKLLQELPDSQRADAVSSMVYEANARIRDPVYGCAGAICQLQKQVSDLQAQLAKAQAELVNMQLQQANLFSLIMEMAQDESAQSPTQDPIVSCINNADTTTTTVGNFFFDDSSLGSAWEPLWT
ncbi:LOB domain-containing protein 1-like [Malania oleifera]|uniref:LOB domain-containing protein 1-like n=1 Tax=Malania oleifera TaxID=397392 RepID=UPI0025ADA6FC|nr:LOB domain-containing protein 1-like [Malania oleifera]